VRGMAVNPPNLLCASKAVGRLLMRLSGCDVNADGAVSVLYARRLVGSDMQGQAKAKQRMGRRHLSSTWMRRRLIERQATSSGPRLYGEVWKLQLKDGFESFGDLELSLSTLRDSGLLRREC